jgi:NAD(P)-dependent dehydrogenase (short-subunit alcohol dehydrogenase family)
MGQRSGGGGGSLTVAHLDVTDPSSFAIPGDLRVLVNNAGVDSAYLPVEHIDLDDWRGVFETNVIGLVAVTKAAIPTLRANHPAAICAISSSSILAPVPFYAAYRASKAAVSAFCDSLRVELAPDGIRVVEILPGPIDTDMFRASTGEPEAARFDRYRPMAQSAAELRRRSADVMVTAAAEAAAQIVDAILDDTGPMRFGCDPLSIGLLDIWRQSTDEAMFELIGRPLLNSLRTDVD